MSENAIDSVKATPEPADAKPKADRTNKKAEVIALMKRANGASLPEIMKATGWQPPRRPSGRCSRSPKTFDL